MRFPIIFLSLTFVLLFTGCSKVANENTTEQPTLAIDTVPIKQKEPIDTVDYEALKRQRKEECAPSFSLIMQSIINGNSDALASVVDFPLWRPYPEKPITNPQELKAMFNILFDDSIRNDLKNYTAEDWQFVGWRGYELHNGEYFWTDEYGQLTYINYISKKLIAYWDKLRKEERQELNESKDWVTVDCLLSEDSTLFFRIEEWDNVTRMHVFTHDKNEHWQHLIFNGMSTYEGSCANDIYYFAYFGELITAWINSPFCHDFGIQYGVQFPNIYELPEYLRGQTISCRPTFWRDVKKWW